MSSPLQSVDHVLPAAQHPWLAQNQIINDRLNKWCSDNLVAFSHRCTDVTDLQACASDKIVSMSMIDLIPDRNHWQALDRECQQLGKRIWFVTNNLIDQDQFVFDNIQIRSYHQLLGIWHVDSGNHAPVEHKKLYNCFMQRIESVRQTWFYLLHLHGLLDRGYVSFLLWQLDDYSTLRGRDLYDYIHDRFQLKNLPHFNQAYQELRSSVPYRNFNDDDLMECIRSSKYSLILETFAVADDVYSWCFTEKLMRSLQTSTINLPFMQKNGASRLKNLGLQFEDIVYSVDNLSWPERQQALIEILVNDTIPFDHERAQSLASHNATLIGQWQKEYQDPTFFYDLFEDVITA